MGFHFRVWGGPGSERPSFSGTGVLFRFLSDQVSTGPRERETRPHFRSCGGPLSIKPQSRDVDFPVRVWSGLVSRLWSSGLHSVSVSLSGRDVSFRVCSGFPPARSRSRGQWLDRRSRGYSVLSPLKSRSGYNFRPYRGLVSSKVRLRRSIGCHLSLRENPVSSNLWRLSFLFYRNGGVLLRWRSGGSVFLFKSGKGHVLSGLRSDHKFLCESWGGSLSSPRPSRGLCFLVLSRNGCSSVLLLNYLHHLFRLLGRPV